MASFPTTRRSVVLSLASTDAEERSRAFDTLVALYWRPLYKYARRAWGRSPEDCEDLTRNFFARVLESGALASYDPSKASFRTFLRLLFERNAVSEARAQSRIKRGGGQTRLDFDSAEAEIGSEEGKALSPEELFQQEWVRSVFRAGDRAAARGRIPHALRAVRSIRSRRRPLDLLSRARGAVLDSRDDGDQLPLHHAAAVPRDRARHAARGYGQRTGVPHRGARASGVET